MSSSNGNTLSRKWVEDRAKRFISDYTWRDEDRVDFDAPLCSLMLQEAYAGFIEELDITFDVAVDWPNPVNPDLPLSYFISVLCKELGVE